MSNESLHKLLTEQHETVYELMMKQSSVPPIVEMNHEWIGDFIEKAERFVSLSEEFSELAYRFGSAFHLEPEKEYWENLTDFNNNAFYVLVGSSISLRTAITHPDCAEAMATLVYAALRTLESDAAGLRDLFDGFEPELDWRKMPDHDGSGVQPSPAERAAAILERKMRLKNADSDFPL